MLTKLCAEQIEIRYSFEALPIISDFSLEVCSGEFVGVIGPNGSGKSTLIRALSRTLRPSAGKVLLEDQDLYTDYSARESAQRIAVVPQDSSVTLDFTVRDIVRMGRAPHLPRSPFAAENEKDERIVSEAMVAAGIADLACRAVPTLSGGERQRAILARALAQEPDVLLLDEPTSHLDLRHQEEVMTLARSLAHTSQKAVLAVLHDLNLAAAHCDRLILMKAGGIFAQGTPHEVLIPENLLNVYGSRVWIRTHPLSGRPFVLPSLDTSASSKISLHVHLICGGGTGAELMTRLHQQGYTVTAGGLNEGDPDADSAQCLGIPFAREAPFSLISAETVAESLRLATAAEKVLLTEVPFGWANLPNLQAALTLLQMGKPVACVQEKASDFRCRDYTGGEATSLWEQLLSEGAKSMESLEAALEWTPR